MDYEAFWILLKIMEVHGENILIGWEKIILISNLCKC